MEGKRILVVDDEEPIRRFVEQALAGTGCTVHCVASAADALQSVKDTLFDAAVIDFSLPDMDGVRLHSEIRRMDAELAEKTLFVSGVEQSDESMRYYSDSGGFLPKPFTVEELRSNLRALFEPAVDY